MALIRCLALLTFLIVPVAAQAQASQTADADAPTPSHIAAALDLLKANHASDNIQAMLDSITPLETQQIKRSVPQASDEQVTLIVKKLRDEVTARQDEMLQIYAVEYARHFNEQELKDLAAFYRSDLGQKYVTTIPALMKEATPPMVKWMRGVAEQVRDDLLKSMPKPDSKT